MRVVFKTILTTCFALILNSCVNNFLQWSHGIRKQIILLSILLILISCEQTLEPKPVDLLTDDIVLNEAKDVANVEIGLYNAFRDILPSTVIAGDFTADMLIFKKIIFQL